MRRAALVLTAGVALLGSACRGQPSDEPPIWLLRDMFHQQKYVPESSSEYFSDHRSMRTPPEGTQSRESYIANDELATGRTLDNTGYVMTVPDDVTRAAGGAEALVHRGHERYGIYCTPCHGQVGDGQGIVIVRGARTGGYTFPPPPSFHDPRVRHMPDGQMFATITNGVRNMPSYAAQIPVQDRWAIVAYVRALELSQAQNPGAAQ